MAEKQYVAFRLEGQVFGADISVVREVNYLLPITRMPNTPSYVNGVMDLRGQVLPVIDLRKRLGLPDREPDTETRVMILDLGERSCALIVDGVEHVLTIRDEEITPPDAHLVVHGQDYVTGVARTEKHLVIVMDLNRLMETAEV